MWSKQRSFVSCYKRAGGYIPERFMEHFFVSLGSDYMGLIVWDNASLKTRFVVFGLALLYVRPNHVKDKKYKFLFGCLDMGLIVWDRPSWATTSSHATRLTNRVKDATTCTKNKIFSLNWHLIQSR